ncbi:MAG: SDR family oxidoreductase [Pseudomonadota bacterium]|nr:SDR family oxidoreductase [Pseudomonadota bacterium]
MSGVMVVTGGSRGIGAAVAIKAGAAGYGVCVNYQRNRKAAQEVVDRIRGAGGTAIMVHADVTSEAEVKAMFRTVDQDLGPLTALVNNAGIVAPTATVEQMSADRINRILAVNVTGSFICAREAIARMSTAHGGKGGAIVNLSSVAAKLGSPNEFVDYAASKGAIDAFTIGLAKELAPHGIRVNAVRPGLIDTEIHASAGEPDRVERLKGNVPMQRVGQAEEVADAVMWLLSEASAYVTGGFIDVSGGR